jgi:hypothetical protein
MTNFVDKIYNKLVKKKEESPELSEEDYHRIYSKLEEFCQFYDEILNDPVINNRKETYNLAAEIFSGLNRLDSILRIEHTLKRLNK